MEYKIKNIDLLKCSRCCQEIAIVMFTSDNYTRPLCNDCKIAMIDYYRDPNGIYPSKEYQV